MVSIDGLVSGINTTDIINQLIDIQRRPIAALQARVAEATLEQTAFLDISARLLSLKSSSGVLSNASTYQATSVSSTNPTVLTATGSKVSTLGSFVFTASKLAQTSQLVTQGFVDTDSSAIGVGTFSIETGRAGLAQNAMLEQFNGGLGVDRGSIKITDRDGNSATIDLAGALGAQDVVDTINATDGINVTAFITGRNLTLSQNNGSTTSNLIIENVGGDSTATDLGIAGSVAGATLTGTDVYTLGNSLAVGLLNDGLGVSSSSGDDFEITQLDGTTIQVDLGSATTAGDVLTAINTGTGNTGDLVASFSGGRLVLTDSSVGATPLSVASIGSSGTAEDLGLTGTAVGGVLSGNQILGDMNAPLLKNFNGGSGVSNVAGLADFRVTMADGVTTFDVNLDGVETALEMLDLIRTQAIGAGGNVLAMANAAGTGLKLVDNTGGASNLTVAALNGSTAAAELGLLGTGNGATLEGTDVNLKYISRSTRLAALNGGKGVLAGKLKITDSTGTSSVIDLSQPDDTTIADVIDEINGGSAGVTASINSTGDGLLITDTAGGTALLRIEEVSGGTTAEDLNILGTAAPATPTINGAFEYTVTLSATDTLEDVARSINDLGIDVQASIVNTGSSATPFRLSIISKRAGKAGELFVDSETSPFNFTTTSAASDAVLLFGASNANSDPILLTSSDNSFREVVPGLTLNVNGVSSSPITVTASRDTALIEDNVARFVETFNEIISRIDELTDFNVDTTEAGLLLGDSTLASIRRRLFGSVITRPVIGVPSNLSLISQVGVRVQQNGRLSFDSSTFNSVLTTDFDGLVDLFTKAQDVTGSSKLTDLKNGLGADIFAGGDDFRINLQDGSSVTINLAGATNIQDVIDQITDSSAFLTAAISADKQSLTLTDSSVGGDTLSVRGVNGSPAFARLGLSNPIANANGVLTGSSLNLKGAPGVARRLDDLLNQITDAINGTIKTATDGLGTRIENMNDSITNLEERLVSKEERLRAQFTRMEIAISESQSTLSRLQSQLQSVLASR